MKSLICAILILCSIVFSTIFVALYTNHRLEQFTDLILQNLSEDDCRTASIGVNKIEHEYKKIKTYLILFMRENEVREIEIHISDIKSAAKADDITGVIEAKNRLILHTQQLRRLSTFSIEAIF